jgi:hypothetical protein
VARAARIASEAELLAGRTVTGRVGDYKIWNDRVAFVLADAGLADGYQQYGGNVLDADIVRAPGEPGWSQMGSIFFGFDQRLFEPLAVEVLHDGDGGETGDRAVVRYTGRDGLFPWLASFMSFLFPTGTIECDMIYEYSLGPGEQALRLDIRLQNRARQPRMVDMVEAVFIIGDGLKPFFEGPGFETSQHQGEFSVWYGLGDRLAYAVLAEEGPMNMLLNVSNVAFGVLPPIALPARGERSLVRYLAVAEGGLDQVQRVVRALGVTPPEPMGRLEGEVSSPGPVAPVGLPVRIHALDETGRHRSVIRPRLSAANGLLTFEAEMPAGRYRLVAKADGFTPSPMIEVDVLANGTVRADLELPPAVPFSYQVTDGLEEPAPARLTFLRSDGPAPTLLPAGFGEERYPNGSALTVWSGTGEGTGWLPPGPYRVLASRGAEFALDAREVQLAADLGPLTFDLPRQVDSGGWLSGDFHVHAQYSPDSSVLPDLRVQTALSEGLPLLVMTEHDTIRDFSPEVEAIPGARAHVRAIAGSEITTYLYGHFQAWPLTEKPDKPNRGGIEWFETSAPELFARMRASERHPIAIQVNHPRVEAMGGYFSALGLDREAGTLQNFENWSADFEAIEVFNGSCSNGASETKLDWYDMLDRGYRFSVSGGSDSHHEHAPLGVPRVYVPTPHGPAELDPQELVTAFREQRVFVSCGPFVELAVEGRGLGETVAARSGQVRVHLRVQAPDWMQLAEARLVSHGQVIWSEPADLWTGGEGAVVLEREVDLQLPADAWLVLEVTGRGSLYPVSGVTPYALTNPIYVDVDGNGRFDPPRPPYRPAPP